MDTLDREHAAVYFHIIWNALREPMQRALEAWVMVKQLEGGAKFPPFMEKLFEDGERRGELRGERRGELKAQHQVLLRLIAKVGIALGDEDRARIQACEDTATLHRWIDNVIGAKTAADILS